MNVQNPPPPPPSKVSIAFQPEPSGSLAVSSTENLTAVVKNDPNNYGVDWSLTCQSAPGTCGALTVNGNSASHTASGSPITYTAPSTISGNSMSVEIVAFATADSYQNVDAPITISTFDSSFKAGSYVLQAQGVDSNFSPYQFAGVIVLDGKGGISSGEQTVNFVDPFTGTLATTSDTNLTGNYFLGSDGRGTITINPNNDTDIGTEAFSFVFLSSSHALIAALPTNTLTISATGTMDLQTSTGAPSGGYAFAVSGVQVTKMFPLALGGVVNIDTPNKISGNGSVSDEILKFKVIPSVAVSGTLTTPDSFGQFTMNLTGGFSPSNPPAKIQFTGYIVDDTHIKLIESDNTSGTGFGSTAGLAIGQGAATGTFTNNTSFSGTYVFGVSGVDLSNGNIAPSTLTSAGVFTADGSGNLNNGFTDTFLLLNTNQGTSTQPQTGAQISAAFGGTYFVDSSGTGRTSLTLDNFSPNPKSGYQPVTFFYLTGNGSPPLVLAGGDKHYPFIGMGIAYAQSATLTFSGDYGFSFTQQNGSENDGTAQVNANSTGTPPSLAGFADVNFGFGNNPDQPFTGSFSTPASNGLFAGTLVGTNNNAVSSVAFSPQIAVDYYIIDPDHGFFVETDLVTQGAQQNGQLSLGYYAVRTPVCEGCP